MILKIHTLLGTIKLCLLNFLHEENNLKFKINNLIRKIINDFVSFFPIPI